MVVRKKGRVISSRPLSFLRLSEPQITLMIVMGCDGCV